MKPVNTPQLEELFFKMQSSSLEVQEAIQHLPPILPPDVKDPLLLTTVQIEDILLNYEDQ